MSEVFVTTIDIGMRVRKTGGDYRFEGTVVAIIQKLSGAVRVVAENDDGLLFIFNPKQLEVVETD